MRSTLKNVIFTAAPNSHQRGSELNKKSSARTRSYKTGENIIGAISAGAVFILIGTIYVTNLPTSLWDKIVDFFKSFEIVKLSDTLSLPAPAAPGAHAVVYNAAFQFCIGIAILQVVVLALRLMMHSPISKTAETVGNLIFWLGAAVLVNMFLAAGTINGWFEYWGAFIVLIGVTMVARAIVYFVKR